MIAPMTLPPSSVLQTITPGIRPRIVFIGDIHGCYAEVSELLSVIGVNKDDIVVSVGDLVRKGPEVVRVVELWRERGYLAVLGNNEEKVLRASRNGGSASSPGDQAVLARRDLVDYLAALPVVIDFPKQQLTTVHGGLLPDMSVTHRDVEAHRAVLVKLRYIRREGDAWVVVPKGEERPGDRLWPQEWRGDRYVVYGHTPLVDPRFDDQALGLDTGCVYGRRLTAAVWTSGSWTLHAVKARRAYAA
jgi:diadenosine tetraphosphatase ApaH/serine/threonine PP2A family protein phosphatase